MQQQARSFAGIDVSAEELVTALERPDGELVERTFSNTDAGIEELIDLVAAGEGPPTHVCLENTGNFSDSVKWALHRAGGVEVHTPNPRRVRRFAGVVAGRGKTDKIDARVLKDFGRAASSHRWRPGSEVCRKLRKIARCIVRMIKMKTMNGNQAYAERFSETDSPCVEASHAEVKEVLEERIETLRERALELIKADPAIADFYERVKAIRGFGDASIISVFGEILPLDDDMGKRQWVAFSGLDPQPWESGKQRRKTRISRQGSWYLRRALFHPAMSAVRWEPAVKAHYERLQEKNGKKKMVALVAVMRKLLVALWGMKQNGEAFDPSKFHNPKFDSAA